MKIAVIGTNFVSDFFMSAAAFVPEIQVTGVSSGHLEHAQAFARKYSIPNVYESLDKVLEDPTIEAVYLAVPNSLHASMTKKCIQAKKAVITEKPFTGNTAEAKEVLDYAKENSVYVHDAIVPLYTDHFQLLKQSLSKVGVIRKAVISFTKYSSGYNDYLAGKNPPKFRNESYGGSWMDLGVYCVADAVGLFGKPKSILSSSTMLESNVDANGSAILKYDGFDVVLLHGKTTDTKITSEIEGEKGLIQFEIPSLIDNITWFDRESGKTEVLAKKEDNAFSHQLKDFVESNQLGYKESKRVPHSLTLDIMEVLETCRKQAGVFYPCDKKE